MVYDWGMRISIDLEDDEIARAARALGIDPEGQKPGKVAADIVRHLAGTKKRSPIADGGAPLKRAGRAWEKAVADYANEHGYKWDLAPLRGRRDLLDLTGTLTDGYLVGAKGVQKGVSAAERLAESMDQARRAMDNLPGAIRALGFRELVIDDVVPWQVIQRPGAPTGRAYAVTELGFMLQLRSRRER